MPYTLKSTHQGQPLYVLTSDRSDAEIERAALAMHTQFPRINLETLERWYGMCDDMFIVRLACIAALGDGHTRMAEVIILRGLE